MVLIRRLFLPGLAVASLSFAVYNVLLANQTAPAKPPLAAPVESPFLGAVAGSGIVEPRTENISIGAHMPGVVVEVFAREGQRVRAGAPLFRIDDRQMQADLKVREAMLASAEAQLKRLETMPRPEEIPPSEAKVREAKARLDEQEDMLGRARRLRHSRSVSEEELVRSQQAFLAAKELYAQSKSNHELLLAGAWGPEKEVAKASVVHAKAQRDQTQTEIDRLCVKAPVDGDVLQVNVRPGEFVGAPPSQALIVLGDITSLNVRVDIDEHDIARFRAGAPARAMSRGAREQMQSLKFVGVEPYVIPKKSLTGDNTERVDTRVLQIIYAVEPGGPPVYVGQQLDVFIDVSGTQPPQANAEKSLCPSPPAPLKKSPAAAEPAPLPLPQ